MPLRTRATRYDRQSETATQTTESTESTRHVPPLYEEPGQTWRGRVQVQRGVKREEKRGALHTVDLCCSVFPVLLVFLGPTRSCPPPVFLEKAWLGCVEMTCVLVLRCLRQRRQLSGKATAHHLCCTLVYVHNALFFAVSPTPTPSRAFLITQSTAVKKGPNSENEKKKSKLPKGDRGLCEEKT